MTFKDLGLIDSILKAIDTAGYTTPTPIQEQAVPIVLRKHDLLGCAQTGTGKTAAFALPILQLLSASAPPQGKKPIRVLVLTPTRELAIQIGDSFTDYGQNTGLRNLVIFGGVSQHAQTEALKKGTDILTATPGRLLDLIQQGFVNLNTIEIFVLDEADRMLDMGFIHDVKKVIAKLPQKRQTLFFSATMPPEIAKLADAILSNPEKVAVTPVSSTAEKVTQSVYFVDKADKKRLLTHLLKDETIKNALVFTRTKHGANRVAGDLGKAGVRAEAIHGNKSQQARQTALSNFKNGKSRVLVATDIAARGIDIDELSHVINFDLPNIPETYVHRIGRTGRAGLSGTAISFCEAEELPWLKDIQKLTGIAVPVVTDHPFAIDLQAPSVEKPRQAKPAQIQKQAPRQDRRDRGAQAEAKAERPQQSEAKSERPQRTERPAAGTADANTRPPQDRPTGIPNEGSKRRRKRKNRRNRGENTPLPAVERKRPEPPAEKQRPVEKREVADAMRKRFASILEVSSIEKQAYKPKNKFAKK